MRLTRFFERKNQSEQTKKVYSIEMEQYSKYNNMQLDDLFLEAEQEQIPYINERNQIITPNVNNTKLYERLYNYQKFLTENLNPNSVKFKMSVIKTVYNNCCYDIKYPDLPAIKITPKSVNLITNEQIKVLLKFCNLKYKALTLHLATTGMRITDAMNITIQDWIESFGGNDINCIHNPITEYSFYEFHPHKTPNIKCQVFSTLETTEAIRKYLIREEEKGKVLKNDLRLFNLSKTINDKIERGYINKYYNRRTIEINKHNESFDVKIHPHMFRKFFITTISANINNQKIISKLAGHTSVETTDDNYVFFNKEDIWKEYKKVLKVLSFEEEIVYREVKDEHFDLINDFVNKYENKEKVLRESISFEVDDLL